MSNLEREEVEAFHRVAVDERPLLERLWSRWETVLKGGLGVSVLLGGTSYVLSYGTSPNVIYPELYDFSIWAARVTGGFLGLYAITKTARWAASSYMEALKSHHIESDIWHHIRK